MDTDFEQNIQIRRATPADASAVAELTNEAYARYVPLIGRAPEPMTADYARMLAEHDGWLLYHGEQLAGLIILVRQPDALLIYSVAVAPTAQKRGHGRRLLACAEQEARQAGYHQVRLYTNAVMVENIALYERLGYVETSREAFFASTRVNMTKAL
jgi:ribosomal protein S18 acetylase RimI-like enzyme